MISDLRDDILNEIFALAKNISRKTILWGPFCLEIQCFGWRNKSRWIYLFSNFILSLTQKKYLAGVFLLLQCFVKLLRTFIYEDEMNEVWDYLYVFDELICAHVELCNLFGYIFYLNNLKHAGWFYVITLWKSVNIVTEKTTKVKMHRHRYLSKWKYHRFSDSWSWSSTACLESDTTLIPLSRNLHQSVNTLNDNYNVDYIWK